MERAVLDTNVLVSGTFWSGSSFRILELADSGKFEIVLSPQIVEEYQRVVQSNEIIEKTSDEQRMAALAAVQKLLLKAVVVKPNFRLEAVREDPADNRVLEAAVAGRATRVITQDWHLLKLREYQGIRILPPAEFLAELERE